MKLENLVKRNVASIEPDNTLDTAIQKMWQLQIRHLPVVSAGDLVGILSQRDVLLHAFWHEPHGQQEDHNVQLARMTRVEEIMTSPVRALMADDAVDKAARIMLDQRISAIPVLAGNSIFGIATEIDILKCFATDSWPNPTPDCRKRSVVDVMSANVLSIASDEATLSAIRLMRDKQIRHLPVIDNGKLIGIVSDRDLLRAHGQPVDERPVSVMNLQLDKHFTVYNVMNRDVKVLDSTATLADAANQMVEHKIGSVPIVDDGCVSGIVTETDLMRAFIADCN